MPAKDETKKDIWAELRKPFPKEAIGKLPRGGIQLDYIGHASVTDRLLSVDSGWTWEPLATDEQGIPTLDADNNLWIKLTVGGVTRIGVGDGKNMKERIGDALRNAAMRFGVALDLWSKEELESHIEHPENKNEKPSKKPQDVVIKNELEYVKPDLVNKAREMMKEQGITGQAAQMYILSTIDKPVPLNTEDYENLILALESTKGDE